MNQNDFDQFVSRVSGVTVTDSRLPLADQGLDSLALLTVLVTIEEDLGVELDPEALATGQGATSAGLLALVQPLLEPSAV